MNNLATINKIESVLIRGDLSQLSDDQKGSYYMKVCESVGLNPLTKPFEYMNLKGKTVLYAGKNCAEQLRANNKISLEISAREFKESVYIVTAKATMPDGRKDESTGVVAISNLKGEDLANALMKAETKAKRRVTLSVCGLGMLDETEVDSIPEARKIEQSPKDEEDRPAVFTLTPVENASEENETNPFKIASSLVCYHCNSTLDYSDLKNKFYCPGYRKGGKHIRAFHIDELTKYKDEFMKNKERIMGLEFHP